MTNQSNSKAPQADETTFARLLRDAVNKPGSISAAYTAFHGYSIGNQLLAMFQCMSKGVQIGPINTYKGWQALGRQVKRGEKALTLCMPITRKYAKENKETGETENGAYTQFVFRNNWFALGQTDGKDVELPKMADFDADVALEALKVARVEFAETDGNVQGYAKRGVREIAISPVAAMPHKTLFHELGHVLLGHTEETSFVDSEATPRNLREAETESVALICCEALGLEGSEYSRGYIQNWWGAGNPIPEKSAQKIFKVANQILKAGRGELKAVTAE